MFILIEDKELVIMNYNIFR